MNERPGGWGEREVEVRNCCEAMGVDGREGEAGAPDVEFEHHGVVKLVEVWRGFFLVGSRSAHGPGPGKEPAGVRKWACMRNLIDSGFENLGFFCLRTGTNLCSSICYEHSVPSDETRAFSLSKVTYI